MVQAWCSPRLSRAKLNSTKPGSRSAEARERAAEEKRGLIRWLRPEFQHPKGAKAATQEELATTDEPEEAAAQPPTTGTAWPKKLPEQIAAIRDLVARTHEGWTIDKVCAAFKGAEKTDVEEVLESLEALGLRTGYTHHSTRRWKAAST